jgi:hypothetical protein
VVGLVLMAALIWTVSQAVARTEVRRGSLSELAKPRPAAIATARPGKRQAPPPAPKPRQATEQEEALRIRSRVMA